MGVLPAMEVAAAVLVSLHQSICLRMRNRLMNGRRSIIGKPYTIGKIKCFPYNILKPGVINAIVIICLLKERKH
jgi:hypothetical protein